MEIGNIQIYLAFSLTINPLFYSMYAAILHQINGKDSTYSIQQLRNLAADFMLSNADDFMPFMDEVENKEQYLKYCEDIRRTTAWGSQLEVQYNSYS